jgi:hypothetical protein
MRPHAESGVNSTVWKAGSGLSHPDGHNKINPQSATVLHLVDVLQFKISVFIINFCLVHIILFCFFLFFFLQGHQMEQFLNCAETVHQHHSYRRTNAPHLIFLTIAIVTRVQVKLNAWNRETRVNAGSTSQALHAYGNGKKHSFPIPGRHNT